MRVAGARHQAEAELIQGLLLEEGVPSDAAPHPGFDVPDMLAAGPRDVMVPRLGRRGRPRGPARRPTSPRAEPTSGAGARPRAARPRRLLAPSRWSRVIAWLGTEVALAERVRAWRTPTTS